MKYFTFLNEIMNKTKVGLCMEVLIDVSYSFEGEEEFIKQITEGICDLKKITGQEVFFCLVGYL